MRFDQLQMIGFGCFVGRHIDLAPGFNLVFGRNEAGKTTLLSFIELMLYGAKRDGVTRRLYLDEYHQYQPWSGAPYEGTMTLTLDNGQKLEVFRQFDKDREKISIHYADLGKEISERFPSDRRGEILFAQELLGLSRAAFLNSALIRQLSLSRGFEDAGDLSAALLRLLGKKDKDSSVAMALTRLEKALSQIGKTDHGKRGGELVAQLQDLGEEKKEIQESRLALSVHKERLQKLEKELNETRAKRDLLSSRVTATKFVILKKQLAMADELQGEIDNHTEKLGKYKDFSAFPRELKEEVQKLEERRETLESTLKELQTREEKEARELEELGAKLNQLSHFEGFPHSVAEEVVELKTTWQHSLANLRNLKGQVDVDLVKGKERIKRLEELNELFRALDKDTEGLLENCIAEEQEVSEELLSLSEKSGKAIWSRSLFKVLANVCFVFASASALGAAILVTLDLMRILSAGFAVPILAVLATLSAFAGFLFKAREKSLSSESDSASNRYEELMQRRKQLGSQRRAILSVAGVKDISELVRLRAERDQLEISLADNTALLLQRRIPKLENEVISIEDKLLTILKVAGYAKDRRQISEESIRLFLDSFRSYLGLKDQEKYSDEQQRERRRETESIERSLAETSSTLDEQYQRLDVRGYTEFLEKAEGRRWYDHHQAELKRLHQTLSGLLAGRNLGIMKRELESTGRSIETDDEETILDEEALPKLEQELRELEDRIFKAKSETDQLTGIIDTLQGNQRDPASVELEIERSTDELERIRRRRAALQLAIAEIDSARETLHAEFAPSLNKEISEIVGRITSDRYEAVMIGDDLSLSVRAPETGRIVPIDELSAGTKDQIVLAARLAIAAAVSSAKEHLPLLLDDSFVEYDGGRAEEAMSSVAEVAESRQVVFFTCHERERDLAEKVLGASANLIELGAM